MALFANVSGTPYLSGLLTADTFLGAPLVAMGDGLNDTDSRWTAMLAFALSLGGPLGAPAPLVGLDVNDGDNFGALVAALKKNTRFYAPDCIRPLMWSDGQFYPVAGPIFAMPSNLAHVANVRILAAGLSEHYVRLSSNNLYGIGTFACGPSIDPVVRETPPVYEIQPGTLSSMTVWLTTLRNVWARGGPLALDAYSTLLGLEGSRPGISTRTHPALVPYVRLS